MHQETFTPKLVKTTRKETDKDRFEQLVGLSSGDRWETTVIVDASEASLLGWALEVETSRGIHIVPLHPGTHAAKRGEPFKIVWGATLQHTRPAQPVRLISPVGLAWEVTDGVQVPTVHHGTVQEVVGINHLPTIVEHLTVVELDISELLALCGRQRITDKALKVIDTELARRGLTTYPALTKEPRSYLIFDDGGFISEIFATVLEPTEAGDEFLETGIGIDLLWDAHNYADPLNYLAKLSGHTRPHFDMALDNYLHNYYVNTGGWRSGEQSLRPEGWSKGWVLEFPIAVSTLNDQIDWLGSFGHAVEIIENTMKSIDDTYDFDQANWERGVLTHVWENDNFIIKNKVDEVEFADPTSELKINFTRDGRYTFSPTTMFPRLDTTNPNLTVTDDTITILKPDLDLEVTVLNS